MPLEYRISFADIPFVVDEAKIIRLPPTKQAIELVPEDQEPPRKHQPMADLVDELNRMIPFQYLQDIGPVPNFLGRNLSATAYKRQTSPYPGPTVRIGDWYYPNGAARWSVFRGLATSSQVEAMIDATDGGRYQGTFIMKVAPIAPGNLAATDFTLQTLMYLLPPRPLAEHGGKFDGLYLVTLVDERYHWQYSPVSLHVNRQSTWDSLLQQIQVALNTTVSYTPIPDAYLAPDPDSHVWANMENAAVLLDAIAYNIGRRVVRPLNTGSYTLQHSLEA